MTGQKDDRIRQRAYQIWERSGGRHGSHDEHWYQAAMEIDAEDMAGVPAEADPAIVGGPPEGAAPKPRKRKAAETPSAEIVAGAAPALAAHTKDAAKRTRKPKIV